MMSRIKTVTLTLVLALVGFASLTLPVRVGAVDVTSKVCETADNKPAVCKDANSAKTTDPVFGSQGVVTRGVRIFLIVVGIIAIFVILINAVKMITSDGNSDSFSKARNGLIYAAIGLVIILTAQAIISLIVRKV